MQRRCTRRGKEKTPPGVGTSGGASIGSTRERDRRSALEALQRRDRGDGAVGVTELLDDLLGREQVVD